jgi:uncharacterized protein (TIGR02271 family)
LIPTEHNPEETQMLSEHDVREVIGSPVHGNGDEKIGKLGQVFLDDSSGQPEFLTVNTGMFGTKESFIPAQDAIWADGKVTVPFAKDTVKDAPNVDVDSGHLDEAEEQRLYEYYNMTYTGSAGRQDSGRSADQANEVAGDLTGDRGPVGQDTSGPNTDEAMTRSEERLQVDTTSQEAGRARLRKYVTTEEQTVTVPVRKERAVLETEPVTDANRGEALSGGDITEEEHEVVLSEERPVVGKVTEPVERVRLGTETVTEQETVTEEVRKEHIEAEGDVSERR